MIQNKTFTFIFRITVAHSVTYFFAGCMQAKGLMN